MGEDAVGGIGYRYDGTGVVPDSYKPPTSNLKVLEVYANWSYGSPVEVGDQVLAYSATRVVSHSGEQNAPAVKLWRTTIDPQARGARCRSPQIEGLALLA